jgi:hypothetical protein
VLAPGGTAIANGWGFGLTQEIGEPLDHAEFPLGGLSLGTLTACDNSLVTLAVHRVFSAGQTIATLGSVAVDPVTNVVDLTIDLLSPLTAQGGVTSAAASSPSPTWVATTVDADSSFNAISFGFEFLSGAGGELSVHFEDEFLFAIEQVGVPAGPASETIALEEAYPAGTYSIAFRLDSASDSSVRLTDIRLEERRAISVPVASWAGRVVLALIMSGIAATVLMLRRSRPGTRPLT